MRELFIGAITLASLAVGNIAIAETHRHSHGGAAHNHKMMEIPTGQPIPSVKLIVHKDALKGYNLEVQTTNFKFAPQAVNMAAKPGEGHAHIYVNGQKVARLYSSWYYLENLKPGKNKITVSLNANNHRALAHNNRLIEATQIVDVPAVNN